MIRIYLDFGQLEIKEAEHSEHERGDGGSAADVRDQLEMKLLLFRQLARLQKTKAFVNAFVGAVLFGLVAVLIRAEVFCKIAFLIL